ncbi:ABC-type bacteriocin/lantibiotic exporter with double-glycine peptidase domain [Hymenobacter luteus]|uniref:ABC-type bacteriocin/lantibiotic exporter with double-glycine peptidase domain n=2 Tax=Hymenobacter TaxID=89966 RepID=A0A7W9SZS0_9BACT|nr:MULTISPECIES: ABC transporter ATP-binding protein [Hymenobacter]MBB4601325.1 ABC-type bacteriocin/lantibiotic exporter with double-glycine peptidase domain [Hymenobacter latericoloratus]MBB6058468.1 ABC-type bacteriocin/lantibiotic exporter with double-glycine peptidase domain [Hymenobacter luteus]
MADHSESTLTPGQRLLRLVSAERRDIVYLYVYAALAGLISLTLPLGVQSVIGFVSSGDVSTSLVVLIGFIVFGTFVVGALQVMQLHLVEYIQQRLFARISFDFAVRLPRVRTESLNGQYLPELVNRLLDTPTLQKGLSTLLVEFTAAAIQILFGLILLSLYHYVFIAFGLLLIFLLALMVRFTGPNGLESSLTESKYKYRVVAWLEDVARTVHTFRHAPRQQMAISRTDKLVEGYLTARQTHFRVLVTQFWGFVAFKTLITAALLILGCWLLISKQINIGQFVAAEIVIILTISAVEKVLLKLDVVYDALTSLDKIGHVLDLPALPARQGVALPLSDTRVGLRVEVRHLSYSYPGSTKQPIQEVTLSLEPGQHLGLAGFDGSGKTTLLRIMAGLLDDYTGVIAYDGLPLQDISSEALGLHVGDNISHQHLFEGTLLQNVTLDQASISPEDVAWALELVGLRDALYTRSQGLNSHIGIGTPLSDSVRQKLLLARALVRRPRLLLLDTFLPGVEPGERLRTLARLLDPVHPWTVVVASNDVRALQLCPRLAVLREGRLVAEGPFATLSQHSDLQELI